MLVLFDSFNHLDPNRFSQKRECELLSDFCFARLSKPWPLFGSYSKAAPSLWDTPKIIMLTSLHAGLAAQRALRE